MARVVAFPAREMPANLMWEYAVALGDTIIHNTPESHAQMDKMVKKLKAGNYIIPEFFKSEW